MSDAVDTRSIAGGDDHEAAITLGEVDIALAWNVRGNAADAPFVSHVQRVLRLPLPAPMTSTYGEHDALLWLGPRSWLFVAGASATRDDFDAARRAINAAGGALFDVSSSQVAWTIRGAAAGRVLNRSCPLDFHPHAFPPGYCAQSMLGHINALFHRPDASPAFVVMVARSYAADAWRALSDSAASDGCSVAARAPFARLSR